MKCVKVHVDCASGTTESTGIYGILSFLQEVPDPPPAPEGGGSSPAPEGGGEPPPPPTKKVWRRRKIVRTGGSGPRSVANALQALLKKHGVASTVTCEPPEDAQGAVACRDCTLCADVLDFDNEIKGQVTLTEFVSEPGPGGGQREGGAPPAGGSAPPAGDPEDKKSKQVRGAGVGGLEGVWIWGKPFSLDAYGRAGPTEDSVALPEGSYMSIGLLRPPSSNTETRVEVAAFHVTEDWARLRRHEVGLDTQLEGGVFSVMEDLGAALRAAGLQVYLIDGTTIAVGIAQPGVRVVSLRIRVTNLGTPGSHMSSGLWVLKDWDLSDGEGGGQALAASPQDFVGSTGTVPSPFALDHASSPGARLMGRVMLPQAVLPPSPAVVGGRHGGAWQPAGSLRPAVPAGVVAPPLLPSACCTKERP